MKTNRIPMTQCLHLLLLLVGDQVLAQELLRQPTESLVAHQHAKRLLKEFSPTRMSPFRVVLVTFLVHLYQVRRSPLLQRLLFLSVRTLPKVQPLILILKTLSTVMFRRMRTLRCALATRQPVPAHFLLRHLPQERSLLAKSEISPTEADLFRPLAKRSPLRHLRQKRRIRGAILPLAIESFPSQTLVRTTSRIDAEDQTFLRCVKSLNRTLILNLCLYVES